MSMLSFRCTAEEAAVLTVRAEERGLTRTAYIRARLAADGSAGFADGDRVRDRLTGFTGIVIGHADYADGRHQTLVQAETLDQNGAQRQPTWVDDYRLDSLDLDAATSSQYL